MRRTHIKSTDRIIAMLLSVVMVLGLIPIASVQTSAATEEYPDSYTVSVTDKADATVVISGADVQLQNAEYDVEINAATDEKGVAKIDTTEIQEVLTANTLEKITVELTVSKEGYESNVQSVEIMADNLTENVSVSLSKEEALPEQATVSVIVDGEATVELNNINQNTAIVDVGSEVPVKITPADGSYIKTLIVDGETISVVKGEAYEDVIKVNDNVAISATIVKEFTVTAPAVTGGTITLNGDEVTSLTVDENSIVEIKVRATNEDPDNNYQISSISINGEEQKIENSVEFTKDIEVAADTTIDVSFAKVYTITIIHNDNGTVITEPATVGGSVTVEEGSTVKITADPDDNYRISEVLINGIADSNITGANYGATDKYVKELAVNTSYTIVITFALNRYNITATETLNGTVSIDYSVVDYNGSTKVSLIPAIGYTIESVKVNGVDVEAITPDDTTAYFLIEGIVEDKQVVATFKKPATADMSNVTFNTKDALRVNLDGTLYVFAKNKTVTFTTEKSGIKIYDTDGERVGGSWNTKSVVISKTTSIGKISIYYKADGEWRPDWHDVAVVTDSNPLNIVIDIVETELDLEPEKANDHGYYNSNVSVMISAEDEGSYSGIGSVEYWVTSAGTETKHEIIYTYEANDEIKNTYKENIIVDAVENNSDEVILKVKVTDRAGNTVTKETTLKINSTKPIVSVDINGTLHPEATTGKYNAARTATVTYIDRATTFNEDAALDGIVISAKNARKGEVPIAKASMITWSHTGDIHKATITFAEDANYTWGVTYTNKADLSDDEVELVGDSVYEFAVDTTPPTAEITLDKNTWDNLVSTLTFGLFKNYTVTAVAIGSDVTTGIYDIVYYKSNNVTALTEEQLDSLFLEGKFTKETITVSADESFTVYARITDLAGNTKYISTDGVIYDKTESVITITPPAANKYGYYNKDIVIPVSVNDVVNADTAYSGIKSVEYWVTNNDVVTQKAVLYSFDYFRDEGINSNGGKLTITDWDSVKQKNTDSFTIEGPYPAYDQIKSEWSGDVIVKSKDNNSDKIKVTVKVTDNAGNIYEKSSDNLAINIDEPIATIDFDDTANKVVDGYGYYGKARTATITVIDRSTSFDAKAATEGITFSAVNAKGENIKLTSDDVVISGWSSDGNRHVATVNFNKDGKYVWSFAYANKADNQMKTITTETADSPYSFTVDKTKPIGTVTINTNTWDQILGVLTFGLYNNIKADVEASATDDISPVTIEYLETDNPIAMTEKELEKETFRVYEDYSVTNDKRFVIYLKITDYAGNYIYINSDGYIVDKRESNVILTPSAANGFYGEEENKAGQFGLYNKNSNVTVDIQVKDAEPYSGIKKVEYWVKNNGVETQKAVLYSFDYIRDEGINSNGGKLTITDWNSEEQKNTDPITMKGQYPTHDQLKAEWTGTVVVDKELNNSCDVEVVVKVVDNAGNETESTVKLGIDNTAPTIDVTFDNNEDTNDTGYFKDNNDIEDDAVRTATVVITERAHHFNAQKAMEGIVIKAVDVNGKAVEDAYVISGWKTEENVENPDATTHTATITFAKDANYSWSIEYEDEAGNKSEGVNTGDSVAPFEFTIDTLKPYGTITAASSEGREETWDELRKPNELTFGFWSKQEIAMNGTSEDKTSPVVAVEYYKVKATSASDNVIALTEAELDQVTTWAPFAELEIIEDEQFTVYIKITDKAGNYEYISTNGLIVDHAAPLEETIAPEITVKPQQPINELYNGDVKVAVKVTDPMTGGTYSGLKSVKYEVLNMGKVTQSDDLYVFTEESPKQGELQQTWVDEITVNSELNNSNDVVIKITAEDNSGNYSEDKAVIKIDITEPIINVTYDNNSADNEKYFKDNRTATIVVTERNFKPEDVKVSITNTDEVIPTIGAWTKADGTGNRDNTTWTTTLVYNADGDYTFDITYTDLANNVCEEVQYGSSVAAKEFTIDKTLPVISVSYDNNEANNEKYFASARTATIVITEHNFDVSRVEFTQTASLNGTGISNPDVSWSNSGDTHTAMIVYDNDGDYTFDITVTDMAANESEAANYGNSVAGDNFVIDQTIEKPVISGVENGRAYKGDVLPSISFSDVNYESCEVKLVRTRLGEKNVDVTKEFINAVTEGSQGGTGSYDTFEKTVENDGIYTLTVKMVDKAGNEETEEYTFTVNRFGSVYVYSDYLVSLIKDGGQYITSVDNNTTAITEDIVITEYNADKLLKDSLKIIVTRDGEAIDVEYTSTPAEIGSSAQIGQSGWYEYVYTINAANFVEDGVYKITLASAYETIDSKTNDSTSVPSNSTSSSGEQIVDSIGFVVDTTAPEIRNIVNLEEAIVNAQSLDVKYTIVDIGGLKSIEVILNGETIDAITEFGDSIFNYSGQFTIGESTDAQTVQIRVTDLAGNVTDTAADDFSTGDVYIFNDTVTVSTSFFVRWYANKPLFWGSIGGVIILAGAILFIIAAKRKKKEEA